MKGEEAAPVIAGLVLGIVFVMLFAIQPILGYPLLSDSDFRQLQDADYTPLLQLRVQGLRDSYKVGEGVDFAVEQRAGGTCIYPELVTIKDIDTGNVIREWDGVRESAMLLGCPIGRNPATAGMTWSTKSLERPIIFNQTGSYAVVAKHLFKTLQKEFTVVAVDKDENDTSSEVISNLLAKSNDLKIVKALLEKYPDANVTVTANYHSKLFEEFEKYDPNGIVQYHVDSTEPHPSVAAKSDSRSLTVTVIFDRHYENVSLPLIVAECVGQNYSSLAVSGVYVSPSKIDDC